MEDIENEIKRLQELGYEFTKIYLSQSYAYKICCPNSSKLDVYYKGLKVVVDNTIASDVFYLK